MSTQITQQQAEQWWSDQRLNQLRKDYRERIDRWNATRRELADNFVDNECEIRRQFMVRRDRLREQFNQMCNQVNKEVAE